MTTTEALTSRTMLTTKITVERYSAETDSDNEVSLTITGDCYPGAKGRKAHPMDRFAPPDDPSEVEILTVTDERGVEIELSDEERAKAVEALIEAAAEEREGNEADRAESIRDRQRDDDDR